jgi:hypothetical protein
MKIVNVENNKIIKTLSIKYNILVATELNQ